MNPLCSILMPFGKKKMNNIDYDILEIIKDKWLNKRDYGWWLG